MKNEVIKPITILADDFLQSLVCLINESELPYFVVESILKTCINDVHIASKRQLEMDRDKYNQEIKSVRQLKSVKESKIES